MSLPSRSFMPSDEGVSEFPYDADEIAEIASTARYWDDAQANGTPFKQNISRSSSGAGGASDLITTPPKDSHPPKRMSGSSVHSAVGDGDGWLWQNTWDGVVSTTTPQRDVPQQHSQHQQAHSQPYQAHFNSSASAWSTDQEDADTDGGGGDDDSSNRGGGPFDPRRGFVDMASLSLEEDYNHQRHGQQQQQQQQQNITYSAPPQQHHQPQQHVLYAHANAFVPQQSPPAPQQHQQGPYLSRHPDFASYQQHPPSSGIMRQQSPPVASFTYPGNGRFQQQQQQQQQPQQWQQQQQQPSSHMSIPAPVLRANQFQTASAFSHSTSGPVRGMPTNQVNYSQHAGQQQMQQQQHYIPRSSSNQHPSSQPLTPVLSSYGSTHSAPQQQHHLHLQQPHQQNHSAHPHSQHHQQHQQYQSHSHPASPRGSQVYLDPLSLGGGHSGSSSAQATPPSLSPMASPILSPQQSPARGAKGQHVHSQQHQQQSHQSQQHAMGRSLSSGVSSLSSSGSNTPTFGAMGPSAPAQAQALLQQQHGQSSLQQQQMLLQSHSMAAVSNSNAGPTSSMNFGNSQQLQQQQQRRPMPIQTGHQGAHQHHNAHNQQQQQGHFGSHPQQQSLGGSLVIKTGLSPHPSSTTSSTTPNPPAPVLSGDSPQSKARFKEFYRNLWDLVREGDSGSSAAASGHGSGHGPDRAYEFGTAALKMPEHERIGWKIAMELADLAKRQNHIMRARHWYQKAHDLEPLAAQVWIEHAKMEEECGELLECERLMETGLRHCESNEALLIKSLKHHERMGDYAAARSILSRLQSQPLDKSWRTILEGGLMEARLGQMATARRVFKYLMAHVNWYGPIYWECARVEERWGHFDAALVVVERGLSQVPRYGPLWFTAFRLLERTCGKDMEIPRAHALRALGHVSVELVWKMHFELAQLEERLGEFDRSRESYSAAILACPSNLRWKIWLSGARMELLCGDAARIPVVRQLLARATDEVPKKMRAMVWLEQSRMEEFLGDLPRARAILRLAQKESRGEWKVFLESVLLELRSGAIDDAIAEAQAALEVHNGTGRLWAILIQLKQKQKHSLGRRLGHTKGSMKQQWEIFRMAIKEVPKSGEVWCEGARLVLNPYAPRYFNLKQAKRFLNFAIQFTPQYGDSFIEYLRLKMILEGIEEVQTTSAAMPTPLYTSSEHAQSATSLASASTATQPPLNFHGSGHAPASDRAEHVSHFKRVQQLCVNAEPNYGSSWFACKAHPLWAPVEVLDVARGMITQHLVANQSQYQQAILRNWYAENSSGSRQPSPRHCDAMSTSAHSRSSSLSSAFDGAADDARSSSVSPSLSQMSLASEAEDQLAESSVAPLASSSSSPPVVTARDPSTAFSPATVRIARQIESGDALLHAGDGVGSSRSSTPTSLSSAGQLTSEDDEDDLQAEYQIDAEFNSLQILYPPIANLSVQDKHRCLYGADPITP